MPTDVNHPSINETLHFKVISSVLSKGLYRNISVFNTFLNCVLTEMNTYKQRDYGVIIKIFQSSKYIQQEFMSLLVSNMFQRSIHMKEHVDKLNHKEAISIKLKQHLLQRKLRYLCKW